MATAFRYRVYLAEERWYFLSCENGQIEWSDRENAALLNASDAKMAAERICEIYGKTTCILEVV